MTTTSKSADSPEDIAAVREFFASISVSEAMRLYQLFTNKFYEPVDKNGFRVLETSGLKAPGAATTTSVSRRKLPSIEAKTGT